MTTTYTKRPLIISNGHKIFQMVIKYTNLYHSKALQNLPKFGIFGLRTNNLATPVWPSKLWDNLSCVAIFSKTMDLFFWLYRNIDADYRSCRKPHLQQKCFIAWAQSARATRLGKFSQIGHFFTLDGFLKSTGQILGSFIHVKSYVFLQKWFWLHIGRYFRKLIRSPWRW
jgi:hypothetical protein